MELDPPIDAAKCYQSLLSLFNGNKPTLEIEIVLSFLNDLKCKEINEIYQSLQVFLPTSLNPFSLKFKELFQLTGENDNVFVIIDHLKLFTVHLYSSSVSKSLPSSSKKSSGSRSVKSTSRSESSAFFKAKSKRENKEKKIQTKTFKDILSILSILQGEPIYKQKISFESGGDHVTLLRILKQCQQMVASFPEGTKNTKPFKGVIPNSIKSCVIHQYFKRISTIKDDLDKKAQLNESISQASKELLEELIETEDTDEDLELSEDEDLFPESDSEDIYRALTPETQNP